MGATCSFGSDGIYKFETKMPRSGNNEIIPIKRNHVYEHDDKDNKYYEKSNGHDHLKSQLTRKKNSLRTTQKEYKNGNVKVVLF